MIFKFRKMTKNLMKKIIFFNKINFILKIKLIIKSIIINIMIG
jgi:hypothetical protein